MHNYIEKYMCTVFQAAPGDSDGHQHSTTDSSSSSCVSSYCQWRHYKLETTVEADGLQLDSHAYGWLCYILTLKLLTLQSGDFNLLDYDGSMPLHLACSKGNLWYLLHNGLCACLRLLQSHASP